jgi:hypothetical protein
MVALMAYRGIDIGNRPILAAKIDAQPELVWLRIADLVIDEDYQRPLTRPSWAQIEKIAAAFTWSHFSPVLVAPVGDRFAIIDGQHRTHAAKMVGLTDVPCMIINLDETGQARAFAAVNGVVTGVSALHVLRAAIRAGEPWALAADVAVKNAGAKLMTMNKPSSEKKPGEVYCVGWIGDQVRAGRANIVTLALGAVNRSGQRDDLFVWSYPFLRAFVGALIKLPRAQRRDLAGFLDAYPPSKLDHAVYLLKRADSTPADVRGRPHSGLFADALQTHLERWVEAGGGA